MNAWFCYNIVGSGWTRCVIISELIFHDEQYHFGQRVLNWLSQRKNCRHFKYVFYNNTVWISLEISLKFVPKVRFNSIPPLVQIMAWRRPGDNPLYEPMMVDFLAYIYVTTPQWVNISNIIMACVCWYSAFSGYVWFTTRLFLRKV